MMYVESFPSRMRQARKMTGFTQKEVSIETGIDETRISKYEKGKLEPSIETLGILANFYGVSSDWLIGLGMQPGNKPKYEITNEYNARNQQHEQKVKIK